MLQTKYWLKPVNTGYTDKYWLINKVKLSNGKVALAPSLCGENCFRVIRDMSDCISFPDERNESLLVIFKKPIWPSSGNKNRYREYGIENLPHEAPGAPKIFRFERLNIFNRYQQERHRLLGSNYLVKLVRWFDFQVFWFTKPLSAS